MNRDADLKTDGTAPRSAAWRSASTRNWLSLSFFVLLTVVVTYPIAFRLADFTVLSLYTDDLLQAWTIKWNIHALLSGPLALAHIWDANIFLPYPTTLAFSEHLLASTGLLLPLSLLGSTPLISTNLGVLITTVLSGWGMYLLVTWLTGNRRAGLVAGVAFAIAPYRLSHITQLNLLSTQWLPFIFLILARLFKHQRRTDLILLIIFTNLQFFSSVNYALLTALGLSLWAIGLIVNFRRSLTLRLLVLLALFAGVTALLNYPILSVYQHMSERMEIVRTLADAKVYGAYARNYILPIGNSLLYGRWLGLPTSIDYLFEGVGVFVSTFPGLVTLILGLIGLGGMLLGPTRGYAKGLVVTLGLILLAGVTLSFGANDEAFGPAWAAAVKPWLPYPYLYELLPVLQGLRGTVRFALLAVFALAILAGFGLAWLESQLQAGGRFSRLGAGLLIALIMVEHTPAPLPGVSVPFGQQPVYAWLAANTPLKAVLLELPYYLHTSRSEAELLRQYQSTLHWRARVNGASGFKPTRLEELGPILDAFPNWQTFDLARQLGVTHLVLHAGEFEPPAWDNMVALLPAYYPSIESIHTVGSDLVLQLKPPLCQADPVHIKAEAGHFPALSLVNLNPATWVSDPRQPNRVTNGTESRQFLGPLLLLPGQSGSYTMPLAAAAGLWRIDLPGLNRPLAADSPGSTPASLPEPPSNDWQPAEIPFANGAVLEAVATNDSFTLCSKLGVWLRWRLSGVEETAAQVELLDQFNRVTVAAEAQLSDLQSISSHLVPLAETVPPGRYQLRVTLLGANGQPVLPLGPDGAPVTTPVSLPIVVRPPSPAVAAGNPLATFSNGLHLRQAAVVNPQLWPGDWLRFALTWHTDRPLETDWVVFTQLLGPDGRVWGQQDNQPGGGWYSTSLWVPGQPVIDEYAFRVAPDAPPGAYRLIVGFYERETLERVAVESGRDFVEIATIKIE
jgi:hypothetical protein